MVKAGTLWAWPPTTCSRRVICALTEAGLDFDFVPIRLPDKQQKSAEFLAIQPFGKVPVWEDARGGGGAFRLFESRAIMQFVGEGTHLVPTDPRQRALMQQWLSVEYSEFQKAFMPLYYAKLHNAPVPGLLEETAGNVAPILDILEAHLAKEGREYLVGDGFTCADLTWLCYLEWFEGLGLGAELERRPAVNAWWGRCRARPSWQYALAGTVMERAKAEGA